MNKTGTYKIISLVLALLLLVNSSGWSINIHSCRGNLNSVHLLNDALCCDELTQSDCHSHLQNSNRQLEVSNQCSKDCCENNSLILNMEYEAGEAISNLHSLITIHVFKSGSSDAFGNSFDQTAKVYFTYCPLILTRDIPVLYQSFLL